MHYESKETVVIEFNSLRYMTLTMEGSLSIIIGIIGILNFINSMLTSIVTRRREFSMKQGICMTNKQLNKLLIYKGIYYALATITVSLVLGVLFSVLVIRGITSNLWFFISTFTSFV